MVRKGFAGGIIVSKSGRNVADLWCLQKLFPTLTHSIIVHFDWFLVRSSDCIVADAGTLNMRFGHSFIFRKLGPNIHFLPQMILGSWGWYNRLYASETMDCIPWIGHLIIWVVSGLDEFQSVNVALVVAGLWRRERVSLGCPLKEFWNGQDNLHI